MPANDIDGRIVKRDDGRSGQTGIAAGVRIRIFAGDVEHEVVCVFPLKQRVIVIVMAFPCQMDILSYGLARK